MPAAVFPERVVAEIWRQHLTGRQDLETEDGQPIKVVYPGMVSGDRGADFVDAVIDTTRKRVRGNIEIHVNSSGWWGHGHHEDPFYNGVVLHVVYHQDRKKPVRLQNGKEIPTLVLERFLNGATESGGYRYNPFVFQALPCHDIVHRHRDVNLEGILSESGEERFYNRVDGFKEEISRVGGAQTLYAAIMESMGYAKNKKQMKKLAGLVPLTALEALIDDCSTDEEIRYRVRARLLGTAGLLPTQNSTLIPRSGSGMARNDWEFFKVRPGNYPDRRLAAMSCLLTRYRKTGMLEGLMGILRRGESPDRRVLEDALLVPAGEIGENGPALLGKERAAVIIVNVLLPLSAACGGINSESALAGRALELFRRYPRLSANNLEIHMCRQLGIDRGRVTTACQQQGLINLYRTYCIMGRCPDCPLIR